MATALEHTRVLRKGKTQSVHHFKPVPNSVDLRTRYINTPDRELRLSFTVSASGTGYTNYRIVVGAEDYTAILEAMCEVDEDGALSAMAGEMAKRLSGRRGR